MKYKLLFLTSLLLVISCTETSKENTIQRNLTLDLFGEFEASLEGYHFPDTLILRPVKTKDTTRNYRIWKFEVDSVRGYENVLPVKKEKMQWRVLPYFGFQFKSIKQMDSNSFKLTFPKVFYAGCTNERPLRFVNYQTIQLKEDSMLFIKTLDSNNCISDSILDDVTLY